MTETQAGESSPQDQTQEAQARPERFGVTAQDGRVVLTADLNQNGTPSATVSVNLSETLDEFLNRNESERASGSVVGHRFEGTTVVLTLDTNHDGQNAVEVRIDLLELISEGRKLVG